MSAHLDFLDAAGPQLRRWLIAGAVMVSMHATAGALALMRWSEDETVATSGSFMLELAPVAMAPPEEKVNLAVGPRTEEVAAAAAVAPTKAAEEKADVDTPNVKEAPLAPTPEVVVQKKEEVVEKPDEKEVKEQPLPPQVNLEQSSVAPQHAKAPPPVEAPPAEVAVAPRQGVSSKPSDAVISWQKAIALHLNKHKQYPGAARERGEEGVATVWFSLDRSGKVIGSRLLATSGFQLLDKEAVEVLSRASPLPRPPSDMAGLAVEFALPIRFNIKR